MQEVIEASAGLDCELADASPGLPVRQIVALLGRSPRKGDDLFEQRPLSRAHELALVVSAQDGAYEVKRLFGTVCQAPATNRDGEALVCQRPCASQRRCGLGKRRKRQHLAEARVRLLA